MNTPSKFVCGAAIALVSLGAIVAQTKSKAQKPECEELRASASDMTPSSLPAYSSVNGISYTCKAGKWVVDEEAMKKEAEEYKHKRELFWAMRSRVLTEKEMAEVKGMDYWMLVLPGMQFDPQALKAEFNAALLQQYKIRDIAHRKPSCLEENQ